jgi:hypothetical protein
MKRFFKNLAKSFLLAGLTGFISLVFCIGVLFLGGTEHAIKHIPETAKFIVLLVFVMLWPVFLGAVYTLKPASEEPEPIEDDEDPEDEDVASWEDEGGAL